MAGIEVSFCVPETATSRQRIFKQTANFKRKTSRRLCEREGAIASRRTSVSRVRTGMSNGLARSFSSTGLKFSF